MSYEIARTRAKKLEEMGYDKILEMAGDPIIEEVFFGDVKYYIEVIITKENHDKKLRVIVTADEAGTRGLHGKGYMFVIYRDGRVKRD